MTATMNGTNAPTVVVWGDAIGSLKETLVVHYLRKLNSSTYEIPNNLVQNWSI